MTLLVNMWHVRAKCPSASQTHTMKFSLESTHPWKTADVFSAKITKRCLKYWTWA